MSKRLVQAGMEVWFADSAASGHAILAEKTPDCLLLDYQLPDGTGLEFLADLQADDQQLKFPVIMLTGQGSESIAVKAL